MVGSAEMGEDVGGGEHKGDREELKSRQRGESRTQEEKGRPRDDCQEDDFNDWVLFVDKIIRGSRERGGYSSSCDCSVDSATEAWYVVT